MQQISIGRMGSEVYKVVIFLAAAAEAG